MSKRRRKICRVHSYADPVTNDKQQVVYACRDCPFEIVYTFAEPPQYWTVPWAYGAANWLKAREKT